MPDQSTQQAIDIVQTKMVECLGNAAAFAFLVHVRGHLAARASAELREYIQYGCAVGTGWMSVEVS